MPDFAVKHRKTGPIEVTTILGVESAQHAIQSVLDSLQGPGESIEIMRTEQVLEGGATGATGTAA
jgi:hypothetical protein